MLSFHDTLLCCGTAQLWTDSVCLSAVVMIIRSYIYIYVLRQKDKGGGNARTWWGKRFSLRPG